MSTVKTKYGKQTYLVLFLSVSVLSAFFLLSDSDSELDSKVNPDNPPSIKENVEENTVGSFQTVSTSRKVNDTKWQTIVATLPNPNKEKLLTPITNAQIELLIQLEMDAALTDLKSKNLDLVSEMDLSSALQKMKPELFSEIEKGDSDEAKAIELFYNNRVVSNWLESNRSELSEKPWRFFDQIPRFVFLDDEIRLNFFDADLVFFSNPKKSSSRELFFNLKKSFDTRIIKSVPSIFYFTGNVQEELKLFQLSHCMKKAEDSKKLLFHKMVHQQDITVDQIDFKALNAFLASQDINCSYDFPNKEVFEQTRQKLFFIKNSLPFLFFKGSPVLSPKHRSLALLILSYLESF